MEKSFFVFRNSFAAAASGYALFERRAMVPVSAAPRSEINRIGGVSRGARRLAERGRTGRIPIRSRSDKGHAPNSRGHEARSEEAQCRRVFQHGCGYS